MKNYLAAILLATLASSSIAEPRSRQVRFMCGSLEDVQVTMEKYGEKLVMASQAPDELTINLLYVNFDTQTSSWFLHDVQTNEYCMMGVGKAVLIPNESPLQKGTGIGTNVSY